MLETNPFDNKSIEEIHQNYIKSIPDKLATLDKIVSDLKLKITENSLKSLRLNIHKLAGSAGFYGFSNVAKICQNFDQDLIQKIEIFKESESRDDWIVNFENYLLKIRQAFLKGDAEDGQK